MSVHPHLDIDMNYRKEELEEVENVLLYYFNKDVNNIIIMYYCRYNLPSDMLLDNFWVELGEDVCNLSSWCKTCLEYVQCKFGTCKIVRRLQVVEEVVFRIQSTFDDIVCNCYPYNVHYITTRKNKKGFVKNLLITNIFYDSKTFDFDAMLKRSGKKYSDTKILPTLNKQFLYLFASVLDDFFIYIIYVCDWLTETYIKSNALFLNRKYFDNYIHEVVHCVLQIQNVIPDLTSEIDKLYAFLLTTSLKNRKALLH